MPLSVWVRFASFVHTRADVSFRRGGDVGWEGGSVSCRDSSYGDYQYRFHLHSHDHPVSLTACPALCGDAGAARLSVAWKNSVTVRAPQQPDTPRPS